MTDAPYRRRRLRLGALLYQLRYYAVPDRQDDMGQITLYRHDPERAVEIVGSSVRLIDGDTVEVLTLEDAITRCKAALAGRPLCATGRRPAAGSSAVTHRSTTRESACTKA